MTAPRIVFILLIFILFVFAAVVMILPPSTHGQKRSSAQEPSPPLKDVPFCTSMDISLPGNGIPLFETLKKSGLILDCVHLRSQQGAGSNRLFLKERSILAARYDEIRSYFLDIRNQIRSLPDGEALLFAEEMLPGALCRAAFPLWLGTPWDFYGASSVPGEGQIACGYFVAATLYAVGFNVQVSLNQKQERRRHYSLAGLPSEQIIRKLVDSRSIRQFSNRPFSDVEEAIKEMGSGVFLVGLDQHVAFLVYDGEGPIGAWHAKPGYAVTLEKPENAPFIAESRYRILGKLDGKSALIWLKGTSI